MEVAVVSAAPSLAAADDDAMLALSAMVKVGTNYG